MSTGVALLNIVLGTVYVQYGTMTLIDMHRNRAAMGFSHFGAAWVAMAFTCGPHHLHHGIHIFTGDRAGGGLDLVAVLVGFPAGVIWFLLRVEAFRGGPGDRTVHGTPWWLAGAPIVAGAYVGVMGAAIVALGVPGARELLYAAPNLLLVPIYGMVGFYVIRTQLANRRALSGWSVSGLALSAIFPTCAVMHGVHALYLLDGTYDYAFHAGFVDWLAVPAGLYFLWVVKSLFRGSFRDWNRAPRLGGDTRAGDSLALGAARS